MLPYVNGGLVPDLIFKRHHDELREFWQAKLLLHVHQKGDGQLAAVALSVVAHSLPAEPLRTLMEVCFPGFDGIRPPFYCSAARIMKGGEVAADLIRRDGTRVRHALVFKDKTAMETAWRTLADELRLNDADRAAMFDALRKWVVADFRRDPNRASEAA